MKVPQTNNNLTPYSHGVAVNITLSKAVNLRNLVVRNGSTVVFEVQLHADTQVDQVSTSTSPCITSVNIDPLSGSLHTLLECPLRGGQSRASLRTLTVLRSYCLCAT